jgi:hypothetical protein
MFGLEKLSFKTKVIIISVIVIFISMGLVYLNNLHSITVVKINDWVLFASDVEGNWYYKANTIYVDDQTNVIRVWIKNVYTDKGKQEFLKTHKGDEYKDIDRSLSMVLINYQKNNYREDRVIYYSSSGDIIGRDELSEKKGDFIPKSVGNKLLMKILEDCNIKR